MKDYSTFVNSAYLITFLIIGVFSAFCIWQFKRNSKKLSKLDAQKNKNKKKK